MKQFKFGYNFVLFIITIAMILSFAACENKNTGIAGGSDTTAEESTDDNLSGDTLLDVVGGNELNFALMSDGSGYAVMGIVAGLRAKRVEIPETFDGKPVVAIAEYAFYSIDKLETVIVPDSVKYIGNYAFDSCPDLTSIELPDTLELLGIDVFEGCDALGLNEKDGALYIGSRNNPYLILSRAVNTEIEECIVDENTRFITEYAFAGCTELWNVSFPDGLRQVGADLFIDCYELDFNLHDGALYLGNDENPFAVLVMSDNYSIKSCAVADGTKIIADNAFAGCQSLESVSIPASLDFIGCGTFSDCDSLEAVRIAEGDNLLAIDMGNVLYPVSDVISTEAKNAEKLSVSYAECAVKLVK